MESCLFMILRKFFEGTSWNGLKVLNDPIFIHTDETDKRVDDCIAVALGDNKRCDETG